MNLMHFFTAIQAIVAVLLVTVILMQKSEGGGLGTGGSPAGLMSARGAADFMTRLTTILAIVFVTLSIILAAMATRSAGRTFDSSLGSGPVPVGAPAGIQPAPIGAVPAATPAPGVNHSPASTPAPIGGVPNKAG